MGKQHLSRLAAPRSWPIERKKSKWIVRPIPGPHPVKEGLPISVILRDILRYVKTKKEVNFILNQGGVVIDKVVRKEKRFPVGFMDVFELSGVNKYYRVVYDKKGRLCLRDIGKTESMLKVCRIIGKNTLKGKRIQLNLSGGRNLLVDKDIYKVGDSVLFDLKENSIRSYLKLENGALVYLIGGRHIGYIGRVKDILNYKGLENSRVVLTVDGRDTETLKEYAFVIGKEKPVISLGEK